MSEILLAVGISCLSLSVLICYRRHRATQSLLITTGRDILWLREQLSVLVDQGKMPPLPDTVEVHRYRLKHDYVEVLRKHMPTESYFHKLLRKRSEKREEAEK